jgi:hypothetical protein
VNTGPRVLAKTRACEITVALLNIICERLWIRDQEYVLKQGLAR